MRPNIIIIVVDALRADHVGCYGGERTPFMDQFASEGGLFEDAYCTWNTTDQSLTSILTGRYPLSHGIVHHGDKVEAEDFRAFRNSGARLLSEVLGENDYYTMAVDWMGRWFSRGFDCYGYPSVGGLMRKLRLYLRYMLNHIEIFQCYKSYGQDGGGSWFEDVRGVLNTFLFSRELALVQDAEYVTDSAIDRMENAADDPFFLLLHYWDVHTPYNSPPRFRGYRGSDPEQRLLDRYRGSARYVDEQLGRLFGWMDDRGLYDDTVVVVTSDHGESLTEHGIYFDHHGLYDVNTHVPLLLRYPRSLPAGQRIGGFVQHVDLVPTLLALSEIDFEDCLCDGENLLNAIDNGRSDRFCAYSEESYVQKKRSIRTDRYRYITAVDGDGYCRYCHTVHEGVEELYDLSADPEEKNNVVENRPEVARRLRQKLQGMVGRLETPHAGPNDGFREHEGDPEFLSEQEQEELKKRLESLGYHG